LPFSAFLFSIRVGSLPKILMNDPNCGSRHALSRSSRPKLPTVSDSGRVFLKALAAGLALKIVAGIIGQKAQSRRPEK
jgi:hypothetical protein